MWETVNTTRILNTTEYHPDYGYAKREDFTHKPNIPDYTFSNGWIYKRGIQFTEFTPPRIITYYYAIGQILPMEPGIDVYCDQCGKAAYGVMIYLDRGDQLCSLDCLAHA